MSSARSSRARIQRRYGSIRFRLTLLFVAIFGFTLIAFSSLLYNVFVWNHQNEFDIALYNHAVDVAENISVGPFGTLAVNPDILSTGGKIIPFAIGKTFMQIIGIDGKILGRSRILGQSELPMEKSDWSELAAHGASFRTMSWRKLPPRSHPEHTPYRLISYLVRDRPGGTFVLQLAVPTIFLEESKRGLLSFLLISVPLTLILATFGGLFLSRRALAPVSAIIEKTRRLSPRQLSERVPVPETDDEIRALSLTLNELLDRLESAFRSQDRFIADASHELKTPLAILRGELDLMRSRQRSAEEVSEFFSSASQELEHLSRVVEDLLLLARVDVGAASLSFEPVRMDEIALEVVSRLDLLARGKGIKIRLDLISPEQPPETSGEFGVEGDADLLRSVLKNLIENAIKFSPDGQSVEVRIRDRGDAVLAEVQDHGRGIAPELISRVFERFYRIAPSGRETDGSSPSAPSGAGLGLAIAKRIIDAHGGTLTAQSTPNEGTTFVAEIKRF